MPEYQSVTIGDLIAQEIAIEAHCRQCGRIVILEPGSLSPPTNLPVPALENRFKCTRCGSQRTCGGPDCETNADIFWHLAQPVNLVS